MLIYSLLFLFPITLYFIAMAHKQANRTNMEKMMLTMGGAMIIGFTIGIFFGGLFYGDFFLSLMISLITTCLIGFVIGMPHGKLPIIEGVFTGGMAGAMGAMTAEMLNIPEVRILLLLLFLLSSLGGFWCFHFWTKNKQFEKKIQRFFLHFFTMIYLIIVTVIFVMYPPFEGSDNDQNHDHGLEVLQ
ncbi:hypothetical protein [Evansella cellulosilytica]|uniref:Uncharacterized protein n=1 Tax=Evansella cellulosilytica (strain ATCC 21833 / DSM 2522 / FERM P-1141 / JCM 9156 / N-4) TaxID=649639 RepID=E6TV19_EVAC2|nr:hypothetical protein [Evansella cellulosilytica]ADU28602.1 hypothetical protein Bcell_0316 [Evansella cellulosilytica DSM 2522]